MSTKAIRHMLSLAYSSFPCFVYFSQKTKTRHQLIPIMASTQESQSTQRLSPLQSESPPPSPGHSTMDLFKTATQPTWLTESHVQATQLSQKYESFQEHQPETYLMEMDRDPPVLNTQNNLTLSSQPDTYKTPKPIKPNRQTVTPETSKPSFFSPPAARAGPSKKKKKVSEVVNNNWSLFCSLVWFN